MRPHVSLRLRDAARGLVSLLCAAFLAAGEPLVAQTAPATGTAAPADAAEEAVKLPPDQLESLVAPIALYPDALLAQTLVASTYPLEIIQLQQWLAKNPKLKDKELVDAVAKQPWDPSIQSMAAFPEVVKRLADDVQWTTDLGNAFLAQQSDVMDAAQRMRKKAKDKGSLTSNEQQKVETKTVDKPNTETKVVEKTEVIVIESSSPDVIYVPTYSPAVVYPPPVYPYPPIYYPPYPAGAAFMTFSVGVMMGAAWGGSCCGCGWGGNDVDINVNNNFNRNTNVNRGDTNVGRGAGSTKGGNKWQHNSQHRGGAPYADKKTANKYGGTARGDSLSNRQASARQQPSNRGGSGSSQLSGGMGRQSGSSGDFSGNRSSVGTSDSSRGGGSSSRAGASDTSRGGGSSSRSSGGGGFGGGGGGYSGSSARASSSRGSSSMGGRGGGGGGGRGRR